MHTMKQARHKLAKSAAAYALAVAPGLYAAGVSAADSTITVKGEVYMEPCTVASSSANLVLDFGKISAKGLQTAKSASGWLTQEQTIALTDCPAGTKTVKARFDGAADPDNASIFKSSGTATNVGIWLAISGDSTVIAPGSTRTATVANGAASFKVGGKLYSEKGSASGGTVSSTVSVTLSYE